MLAKNGESALAGLGCRFIRQPRQPIDSETEFAKASQGPADEFIVRVCVSVCVCVCLICFCLLLQLVPILPDMILQILETIIFLYTRV